MNRKVSLRKSFVEIYGKELIFSETDKKKVFNRLHTKPSNSKVNLKWGPAVAMVLAPFIFILLLFSLDKFAGVVPEKHAQSTVIKSAPESVKTVIGDSGIQKLLEQGKFQQVNQTVKDKGISITLHEIMYDGTRLAVIYSYETDSKQKIESSFPIAKLMINGQQFIHYSGSVMPTDKENKFLYECHLTAELPDHFDLNYEILSFGGIKGKWIFTVPIKKIEGLHKKISPNGSVNSGNQTLIVNQVTFTPSTTNLKISLSGPEQKDFSKRYVFEIRDNQGNQIENIQSAGTSGERMDNGFFITNYNEYFEPIGKLPQSITIQPFLLQHSSGTVKAALNQKLPIYLQQDQYSGIRITKVEQYQDEIWLYYTIKGPYENVSILSLLDKATGKESHSYDRLLKNKDGYIAKFKTSQPIKELTISAPKNKYTKLKDLKLEINIE
jgi:hypothetical protein